MGDKVTLVRPDGSLINVNEADAGTLRTLGYRDQTTEQEAGAAVQKSTQEYYTTPGQKVLTGIEGTLGGATLGLSDLAFDRMGFDTAERAGYNPGIRLGTELVGGLAGLTPLGKLTPVGLLGEGARAAGGALAEGKAAQTAIAMGIEGGGIGAGAAVTNSVINGDPLTAEAIMAGVGWGSVWGGGLGLLTGKMAARAEARAAAREAAETVSRETSEAWDSLRSTITDISEQAGKLGKEVDAVVSGAGKNMSKVRDDILNVALETEARTVNQPGMGNLARDLREARRAAGKAYGAYNKAVKAGEFEKAQEALASFEEHTNNIAGWLGIAKPEVSGFAAQQAKFSANALKSVGDLAAVEKAFKGTALGSEEFAKMTAPKAEKLFGAVDTFLKNPAAEFAGQQEALKGGIAKMQEALGLSIDGPPSTQLRGIWETMKSQMSKRVTEEVAKAQGGVLPWARQAAGYYAGSKFSGLAKKMGAGTIGRSAAYEMGRNIAHGLVGLKSAVVGAVSKAANEWVPAAVSKAKPLFPRIEPLATRLDGSEDKENKTRAQMMEARAFEIREAAGSVRDTMYKSVAPLSEDHPDLAAALHQLGAKQFMFLMDKLPRDPGLAFNRLKSLWRPDPAQAEKFARYYQVFQSPVAVVQQVLKTGRCNPEWAEGLREMYPAMYAELRVSMLQRLSNPAVLSKMSYNDQVNIGTLLHLPIHSTLMPQFVATQQQMYMEKNQKLGISPQPGVDNGGGRPAGPADVSGATSAQKIEAH